MNFGRVCMANFLLYASVYLIIPLLPQLVHEQLQLPLVDASLTCVAFGMGMLAVGPFSAYLGDTYKWKHVQIYGVLLFMAAVLGLHFATVFWHFMGLSLMQGIGFGLAEVAEITIGIDITPSSRRSGSNKVFACVARLGMLLGVLLGLKFRSLYDSSGLLYMALAGGAAVLFCSSRIDVKFRAPIGLPVCNIDRFLLLRGWFPALNVWLLATVVGMLIATAAEWGMLVVGVVLMMLAVWVIPFITIFVKLSHHCQRGTANNTCQLAVEVGILTGMYAAHQMYRVGDTIIFLAIIGILCFILLTLPYYHQMRVR
ncbi:sugar transporter [gut metagenome]|uniref:Sugar transporter n=1 Tax=gut metagenome TaxID=749906 RepID=J9GVD1_9ZZZZ